TDRWDEIVETLQGALVSTDTELGGYRIDHRRSIEISELRTALQGQISEIRELQATDRRRQTAISELLRIDHRRSTETSELRTALQGQVTALQSHVTTLQGQHGLAGDPTQPKLPEEAGGSA
nr:hypothetical protein [Tanacetum cinerariifolium]